MRILLLAVVVVLSGCGYKCGDIAYDMGKNPYDVIGILTDVPFVIGEALVCPENLPK